MSLEDPPLIDALSAAALRMIDRQYFSNIAWAFALLGLWNEPLLHAISAEAIRTMAGLERQEAFSILWLAWNSSVSAAESCVPKEMLWVLPRIHDVGPLSFMLMGVEWSGVGCRLGELRVLVGYSLHGSLIGQLVLRRCCYGL